MSSALEIANDGMPRATSIHPFKGEQQNELVAVCLKKYQDLKRSIDHLVARINEIDSEFRPLIVWLYIDHLSQGSDLSHARELLTNYIALQRAKYWGPGGISAEDEKNAALITICQGLSTQNSQHWDEHAQKRASQIDTAKHSIILGIEQDDGNLRPLEPDIVGELFALDKLFGANSFDTMEVESLIADASRLNAQGLIGFLFRATNDFPAHPTFKKILNLQLLPDLKGQLLHFLILGLNQPGPNKNRELLRQHLDSLLQLTQHHPSPVLNNVFSGALTNSSWGLDDIADFEHVASKLNFAEEIFKQHFTTQIAIAFAGAIGNLISAGGLDELGFSRQHQIASMWTEVAGTKENVSEATQGVISRISNQIINSYNSRQSLNERELTSWLDLLDELCSRQPESDYSYHSAAGTLIDLFKRACNSKHFEVCEYLEGFIMERISMASEQQLTDLSTQLFSETQKVKNSGDGYHAYKFLEMIAPHHNHATILLEHAYDPENP